MLGEPGVQVGFEPAVVLDPLRERVADDADVVALFELERLGLGGPVEPVTAGADGLGRVHGGVMVAPGGLGVPVARHGLT